MTDPATKHKENLQRFPKFEVLEEIFKYYREDLDTLKSKLNGEVEDLIAYRFLKGWKFDQVTAAAELNKMLEWRKTNKIDEIRQKVANLSPEEFPFAEALRRCLPVNSFHGFDKSGQPITIERLGRSKLGHVLRIGEGVALNNLYTMEKTALLTTELAQKTGKVIRICRVVDLDGVSFGMLSNMSAISLLKSVIGTATANYPESLGNMYIVNAPRIFDSVWGMVQGWLKETTRAKIQVINPANTAQVLKSVIDESNLPEFLGGSCTCKERGGCCPDLDPDEGMTIVDVAAWRAHSHKIPLKAGQVLSWEFRTQDYDIQFSVATAQGKVIVENAQVDSNKRTIEGSYEASEDVEVVLKWDNTYSKMRGKRLAFRVEVADKKDTQLVDPNPDSDQPAQGAQESS